MLATQAGTFSEKWLVAPVSMPPVPMLAAM
jgi:hypothetical protein